MKRIYFLFLIVISLSASEPIKPIIGFIENGYKMGLTNDGTTLISYDGELIPPELKIINLKDMSYQVYKDHHFSITDKFHSNSSYYIISDKEYIRLYDSKNPMKQIKILENKYKHIYLSENYLYGIEKDSTLIHIHTLPEFKEIDTITVPRGTKIQRVIMNDKKIYLMTSDKFEWFQYIIDVDSKTISNVTSNFINMHQRFDIQWILEDGSYIIGDIGGQNDWRVFDTATLERNSNLEKYLNEHPYIKHISKYSDDQIVIVHNMGIDFWDMKKYIVIRSLPLSVQESFTVIRQNNTIIIADVFLPFQLIDLTTGKIIQQPYVRHKPYALFIEKNIPKAVLRYSNTQAGVWNLIEHKWEYFFPEKINPKKISHVLRDDNNLFFVFHPFIGNPGQPILRWSLSEKKVQCEYPTDQFNNVPNMISIDKKSSKLLIHLMDGKFYIFDIKNGKKLHESISPDRHPNVYNMKISEDGKRFIVYTSNTSGIVASRYKYSHYASIYTWSLDDGKMNITSNDEGSHVPNDNPQYGRNDKDHLVAKDNKIEVFWDEKTAAIALKRLNNPYRYIYLYTPNNASSWIDIDNQGYFDTSSNGEKYLFQCQEKQCDQIDEKILKYYKRKNMVKTFLKE